MSKYPAPDALSPLEEKAWNSLRTAEKQAEWWFNNMLKSKSRPPLDSEAGRAWEKLDAIAVQWDHNRQLAAESASAPVASDEESTDKGDGAEETKGDKTVELLYNPQETPKVEDAVIALTDKLASVNRKVTVKALPDDITKYTQTPNVDTFVIYFFASSTRFDPGDVRGFLEQGVPESLRDQKRVIVVATRVVGPDSDDVPPSVQYKNIGVELTVGMTAEYQGKITVNDNAVNRMVAYIEGVLKSTRRSRSRASSAPKGNPTNKKNSAAASSVPAAASSAPVVASSVPAAAPSVPAAAPLVPAAAPPALAVLGKVNTRSKGPGRVMLQPRDTQVHSQMMTCDPQFVGGSNFNAVRESILQGDLMMKFEPTGIIADDETAMMSGYSNGSAQYNPTIAGLRQEFIGIAMSTEQCLSADHALDVPVAGAGVISTLNRSNDQKSFPAMYPIAVDVSTGFEEADTGRITASLDSTRWSNHTHAKPIRNACVDTNLMSIAPSRFSEQLDVVVHL